MIKIAVMIITYGGSLNGYVSKVIVPDVACGDLILSTQDSLKGMPVDSIQCVNTEWTLETVPAFKE